MQKCNEKKGRLGPAIINIYIAVLGPVNHIVIFNFYWCIFWHYETITRNVPFKLVEDPCHFDQDPGSNQLALNPSTLGGGGGALYVRPPPVVFFVTYSKNHTIITFVVDDPMKNKNNKI